ncbi:hypothetical protein [Butyricicoccus porcorum]|uniref:hypothetical protein n=1 Tax=Butyricicoccus porcorum TaxID=1945634 RepID=UPI003F4A99E3
MCAKKTGKTLPKYETHVAPRMDEIKTMFENGARMKDVAQALGVSPRSMFRYANDHPRLRELIEEAKKPADDCVEYAFYRTATGFHYKEKKIEKDEDGNIVKETVYEKYFPPSPQAAFRWLLNRRRDQWSLNGNETQIDPDADSSGIIEIPAINAAEFEAEREAELKRLEAEKNV